MSTSALFLPTHSVSEPCHFELVRLDLSVEAGLYYLDPWDGQEEAGESRGEDKVSRPVRLQGGNRVDTVNEHGRGRRQATLSCPVHRNTISTAHSLTHSLFTDGWMSCSLCKGISSGRFLRGLAVAEGHGFLNPPSSVWCSLRALAPVLPWLFPSSSLSSLDLRGSFTLSSFFARVSRMAIVVLGRDRVQREGRFED